MGSSSKFDIFLCLLHFLKHWLQFLWKMLNLRLKLLDVWVWIITKSREDLMSQILLLLKTEVLRVSVLILLHDSWSDCLVGNPKRYLLCYWWYLLLRGSIHRLLLLKLLWNSWLNLTFALITKEYRMILQLVFLRWSSFLFPGWNHV